MFEVKIIGALQGSAKTNTAFLMKFITCVYLCIHIKTKNLVNHEFIMS